jgi:hypothetical protein
VSVWPVRPALIATPIQFPAVFAAVNASVDDLVVPAFFPERCTREMLLGVDDV